MGQGARQYLAAAELHRRRAKREKVDGYYLRKGFGPTSGHVQLKVNGDPSDENATVTYIISTAAVDSYGDTISVDGWDLGQYNGVVLWSHDHRLPSIGFAPRVYVEGDQLKSECRFSPEDLNPFGAMIGKMVRGGFIRDCSVGFRPTKYSYSEERKGSWGMPGVDFEEQILDEYSICNIGANPEAKVDEDDLGLEPSPEDEAKSYSPFMAYKASGGNVRPMLALVQRSLDGDALLRRPLAEALYRSLGGATKSFSIPSEATMAKRYLVVEVPDKDSDKLFKALQNQVRVHGATLVERDAAEAELADAVKSLKETVKDVRIHVKEMGQHCDALGGHRDALGEHKEEMGKLHKDMASVHKDMASVKDELGQHCDDLSDSVKELKEAIGSSNDDPGVLGDGDKAAGDRVVKGGAPHKLSKKSRAELTKAEKAIKNIRSLDESGKLADELEDEEQDDDADDGDGDGDDDDKGKSGKGGKKKSAKDPEPTAAEKREAELLAQLAEETKRTGDLLMKTNGTVPPKAPASAK